MNENYFLSLIICCYNKEKRLRITLDSIVNQSIFKHIEVICINDHSEDNTPDILDEYASKYYNIKVQHLPKNSSVFVARLIGLKIASAPYITFIDPDDYVEPDYYLEMVENITEEWSDITLTPSVYRICDNKEMNESTGIYKLWNTNTTFNINKQIFENLMKYIPCMTLWNAIFKSEIIKEVLRLPATYINFIEDNIFFTIALMNSNKMTCKITQSYYHYYYKNDVEHLSSPCSGFLKSSQYIDKVFNLLSLYIQSNESKYGKFKKGITISKNKYITSISDNIYKSLIKTDEFKTFFTNDVKPKDNIYELMKDEKNAESLDKVKLLITVIKKLNDLVVDCS